MKWLGYKQVNVSSIILNQAEIKRRMKQPHVVELAADIAAAGEEPIHAPTIRSGSKTLLCGRDRIAAEMLNERRRLWVHVAECDDQEAKQLELRENIYRRPCVNRAEMLAELVGLKEQQIRAEQQQRAESEGVTLSQAPQDSPKALARKEVARAAGVTPAAVRQAEVRAAKSDGPGLPVTAAQQPGEAEPSEPCLDLLGCEGDASLLELAASEQAKYDEADKHLRQAVRWVGMIEDARAQQELTAQVQRVGSLVRSARPAVLCPWCKDLPLLIKQCPGCRSIGYVSAETAKRSPRECTDLKAPVVCVNGNFYPYAEAKGWKAIPGAKNGKPQSNGKSISVEMPDGNVLSGRELTVERDEDEAF